MHLHMLLWIPTFSVGACAKAEEDGEPCEEWREGERQKRKGGGEGGREDNIQEQGSKIRTKTTLITMASFHCEAILLCSWKYWQELYLEGSLVLLFIKDWQTSIWWSPSLGMPCRCACISAHMHQLSCKRETYLPICTFHLSYLPWPLLDLCLLRLVWHHQHSLFYLLCLLGLSLAKKTKAAPYRLLRSLSMEQAGEENSYISFLIPSTMVDWKWIPHWQIIIQQSSRSSTNPLNIIPRQYFLPYGNICTFVVGTFSKEEVECEACVRNRRGRQWDWHTHLENLCTLLVASFVKANLDGEACEIGRGVEEWGKKMRETRKS